MARTLKPLTVETLQDEVRFLLKTLLRDDLFGAEVGVSEAEKLLESSLSVAFVEYAAFLKRHAFLDIDRQKNTLGVLPRGKNYAEGNPDPSLGTTLAAHFSKLLGAREPSAPPPLPSSSSSSSSSTPASSLAPTLAPSAAFLAQTETLVRARPEAKKPAGAAAALALLDKERYVRGEPLGQGSLGIVLLAKDTTLERDVVVKEVRHVYDLVVYLSREEITARIKSAVMAQARLDHPHVLRVVDVSFAGDAPTVVVDRAVESLAARMARALMPVESVVRVLLQICYGLRAAHSTGLIHAGLKPENVLFDVSGNVKLSDFGIARVTERDLSAPPNSSAPPVYVGRGHPSYMAPEQLHKGKASAAGDIYALGILLYEMLTGNLPGRRSPMPSASERVVAALGKERVTALDDIFDRMTRDPLHERFASVDDLLAAIYAAFPANLVGTRGTLLLSERDESAPVVGAVVAASAASAEVAPEVTAVTRAPIEVQ
jgi:hypothetical protein